MIHKNPVDVEVAFTNAWWTATVADEVKLRRWLQKLQQTEIGGWSDYQGFMQRFDLDQRTETIFANIADDEKRHSSLIIDLLNSRHWSMSFKAMPSAYWDSMNEKITDVQTAAAVNYFGEALAAFRFELIVEHKDTPGDIKELISIVLPDEQFHRQTLKRIAGDEMLAQYAHHHFAAVNLIKGNKNENN